MEDLKEKLAEILEVEDLDMTRSFADYEEFDSLAILSILAMLDADYNKTMKASDIRGYSSIQVFCDEVLS